MATNHETAGSSPVSCANGDPSFTDRRIAAILHLWWKWHARSLEVAVLKGMRVRISPDAPKTSITPTGRGTVLRTQKFVVRIHNGGNLFTIMSKSNII